MIIYTQPTAKGFRFAEFTLLGSHFSVRVQVRFNGEKCERTLLVRSRA
jgi:hypothetical protein